MNAFPSEVMVLPTAQLGSTGVRVTRFSLGCAPLAGLFEPVGDEQAADTLAAAWTAGIRYFDTAPLYGLGLSERRTGAFLATQPREAYVLSTKVGRLLLSEDAGDAERAEEFAETLVERYRYDYSRSAVLRSIEESLQRLGVDRIDLVFIHDPDEHWEQAAGEAYPALHELREQGVVRAIGAGMNQSAMLTRFVRETDMDCVLLAGRYTLLDQSALADLLPACEERSVSVIAASVFNSGILAAPRPGATYEYAEASADMIDRASRVAAVCARHDVPLPAAAVQFPLGHPAVATVLVGARSADEVTNDVEMFSQPAPAEMWAEVRAEGLLPDDVPLPE